MLVDGGHGHAADPLEVPGGWSVPGLDVDVEEGQGEQHGADPGDGVDGDNEWFNHTDHVGQEDIEDEGEAVVHCAQVTAEPVKNLTEESHIKEFDFAFYHSFQ